MDHLQKIGHPHKGHPQKGPPIYRNSQVPGSESELLLKLSVLCHKAQKIGNPALAKALNPYMIISVETSLISTQQGPQTLVREPPSSFKGAL